MAVSPPVLNPSPLTLAVLSSASTSLLEVAQTCISQKGFEPLLLGIVAACEAVGLRVDRVQIPATRYVGFRHPVFSIILSTWQRGEGVSVHTQYHAEMLTESLMDIRERLRDSPYHSILFEGQDILRQSLLSEDLTLPFYRDLRDQGYVDYLVIGLPLPQGHIQVLSLASRFPFPADAEHRLMALRASLALTLFGVYASSSARQLAMTYVGVQSGQEVLSGDMYRGRMRSQEAGILFLDVRGFTSMTENIGAASTVEVLNAVFERVGDVVLAHDGEILKFIGDAMLVIFAISETRDRAAVATSMVAVVQESLAQISPLSIHGQDVQIGFGGHIGEVQMGNIGTRHRLDFTVIGSAVNLSSRLEGLCSPLGEQAVFSQAVADVTGLHSLGQHAVKGIQEPVAVFGLPRPSPSA